MTDKVQKIREEVERIINRRLNLINGDYFDLNKETDGFTNEIMNIIDSLQGEVENEDLDQSAEKFVINNAEKFIEEHTKNCSNELVAIESAVGKKILSYREWLTLDDAREAVEITREEALQEVKEKLLMMLNTSIDNKHFFVQLDDYIDEIENKQ